MTSEREAESAPNIRLFYREDESGWVYADLTTYHLPLKIGEGAYKDEANLRRAIDAGNAQSSSLAIAVEALREIEDRDTIDGRWARGRARNAIAQIESLQAKAQQAEGEEG